jgi:hypothetical protein
MPKGKPWNEAKLLPHDASGIDKPKDYLWEKINGIYYPVKGSSLCQKQKENSIAQN